MKLFSVAAGWSHSLALNSDGTVIGWGKNDFMFDQARPPLGLSDVTAIAAGDGFSLAVKSDGTLAFWGNSGLGVLNPPVGMNVVAVATNGSRAMELTSYGTVVVWGLPYPALLTVPSGLSNVVAIAMGIYNCLALKSDGDSGRVG